MIDILGGGPAGLATAYYAQQQGLPFRVFEGSSEVGGNCRTLRLGNFLFDTGAHRLHDRDRLVTTEIQQLLGDDLVRVSAPSQIYHGGAFIGFPLYFGDIVRKLDIRTIAAISAEQLRQWFSPGRTPRNFEQLAIGTYGPTLAGMFLLNYSEKLWGRPCDQLSTLVAGNRLKGLDVASFIRASLLGRDVGSTHIDGSFYYPKFGIGSIFKRMAETIGHEHIRYGSRITALRHDGTTIRSFVVNNGAEVRAGEVVSTLPLTSLITILDPPPPPEIVEIGERLSYRHLILAVFGIRRERVSDNASIYFPGRSEPYTRLYESKNRSRHMAPDGETSIVLEIPCQLADQYWSMGEPALRALLLESLRETIGLEDGEITAFRSYKVPYAYPVLEVGFEDHAGQLLDYAGRFQNLHLAGRSARFHYVHIHDLIRVGREIVESIA